ncbi:hypothetical protein SAY87_007977 [Trapa incisa]|uniref:CHCH domain-containing protein n=1 Tax=Trapa incisa TaxID=236973 RepID=A0AAN7KG34_9MYRT|nr:hypothetical protein SAY87_007977 [Trapa incisa]
MLPYIMHLLNVKLEIQKLPQFPHCLNPSTISSAITRVIHALSAVPLRLSSLHHAAPELRRMAIGEHYMHLHLDLHHAPPPAPAQPSGGGSILGGIGSTIAQGMAFGSGSALAHQAVDAVMGPRTIQHETVVTGAASAPEATTNSLGGGDACSIHSKAFQDCLNNFGSDISRCQFYLDMLNECRRNTGSGIGA